MKVFVSYSFNDSELYLLSLLLKKLKEQGYHVSTPDFYPGNNRFNISQTEMFIGIMTNNSDSIDEVFEQFSISQEMPTNYILLIEKGIKIESDFNYEYIRFDRKNPQGAIDQIFGLSNNQKKSSTSTSDVLVGVGIVAGIAALISLLAGGGKK